MVGPLFTFQGNEPEMLTETQSALETYRNRLDELRGFL